MTDKELKDWCKTCDVEPPAMKFKCPECEHNTDKENNFTKDINVSSKEQIILDLKKEYNEYISTHKYSNEEFQQERETVADLAFWSNKYKRGLEKIEKELKEDLYCESQECGCDDFEECLRCTKEHILDIINKAKGK